MRSVVPTDITFIAWIVVAVGALCLAVVILKFPPTNRPRIDPSTIALGGALILGAIGAAGYAITLL